MEVVGALYKVTGSDATYNVVGQLIASMDRCPECGGKLPDLGKHAHPLIAWKLIQSHPRLAGALTIFYGHEHETRSD